MRVLLQPAFILHYKPYRETSLILEVFTKEHGRISLVARGVRSTKSRLKPLLQPFVSLLVSWQGKSELMNLTAAELHGSFITLQGGNLLSGFYLNELLMRSLQKHDPHSRLFDMYQQTLQQLHSLNSIENILRIFEKNLLQELGYAIPMKIDFSTGNALAPDQYYHYYPDQGFKLAESNQENAFKGEHLLAFANENLVTNEQLRDAKKLMRIALAPIAGVHGLHSKNLFIYKT